MSSGNCVRPDKTLRNPLHGNWWSWRSECSSYRSRLFEGWLASFLIYGHEGTCCCSDDEDGSKEKTQFVTSAELAGIDMLRDGRHCQVFPNPVDLHVGEGRGEGDLIGDKRAGRRRVRETTCQEMQLLVTTKQQEETSPAVIFHHYIGIRIERNP